MRIVKLFIIYLIIIIYSLEILIFFFIPSEQKNMVDIKNTRIKLAKEKKINFDVRSPEQVYVDLKSKNENVKPGFLYAKHFSDLKIFKDQINPEKYNGATLIGLNGISIKSHGSASPFAFNYAIKKCFDFIDNDFHHLMDCYF